MLKKRISAEEVLNGTGVECIECFEGGGLNKFLLLKMGAYGRGGLIERGA